MPLFVRSLREVMIVWSPERREIKAVLWPDRGRRSDDYLMSVGACFAAVQSMTWEQRKLTAWMEAMHIAIHGEVDVLDIHRAWCHVAEYVDGCSMEVLHAVFGNDCERVDELAQERKRQCGNDARTRRLKP